MRRRRAILFDADPVLLNVLRNFFELKDYEVMTFTEPVQCPVYCEVAHCSAAAPCGDIMVVGFEMPRMSGIELIEAQHRGGCSLSTRNKAVLSTGLAAQDIERVRALQATFFKTPIDFGSFGRWVDECEERMDLARPLLSRRREMREPCDVDVLFQIGPVPELGRGTAVNLSWSGLCLRMPAFLSAEQTVTIRTPLPLSSPNTRVCWSRKDADGAYIAGLQCY